MKRFKTVFDDDNFDSKSLEMIETMLLPYFTHEELELGPRLEEINWTEEFRKDIITKRGFIVKAKAFDKFKNAEMDGIHSPRFGTTWSDDNAFAERYKCACGTLMGKLYEGETCPYCKTKVQFVDIDLNKYAWYVLLHDYYIIQPAMFKKLESFIGKRNLAEIVEFKYVMDRDGYFKAPEEQDKKKPYYGIGMYQFCKQFDDIMEYYKSKRKNKLDVYENIMQNKEKVFTQYIPVYSAILRPVFLSDEDYSYTKIDRKYNSLYGNILNLNKEAKMTVATEEKINKNLFKAQMKLNEIYKLIFDNMDQKDGWIRENILGGRINFSARNVITPDTSLRADQIRLPYLTFLMLYQAEIINLMVKINGVSFTTATNEWNLAQTQFNPKVYEIMKYIIKHTKHKVKVLVNRNPTINFGSIMAVNVIDIKQDFDDLSMSLSAQVLTPFNADFDGDVLNIYDLKSNEFKKEFSRIFNPRKSMFINRNDGLFDDSCSLIKDQMIGLYQFCNC